MTAQRPLLLAIFICFLTFAGHSQMAGIPAKFGRISLTFPRGWNSSREAHQDQKRITFAPDSMKNLALRIVEIYDIPVTVDHTYEALKENFAAILNMQPDWPTKTIRTEEITFKGYKTMYAEIIRSSLPGKVYAVNAGDRIYMIILLKSRHVGVPDPKMEQDGAAIVNSITIDKKGGGGL